MGSCLENWGVNVNFCFNSLAPGRYDNNFGSKIFKLIPQNSSLGASCEIALRWLPQNLSNVKSTLVQVMAWCHQATGHYLNQCWPRSLMSYGVTRPQWVNANHDDAAVKHPAIMWTSVDYLLVVKPDLNRHMISLGHNELISVKSWNHVHVKSLPRWL